MIGPGLSGRKVDLRPLHDEDLTRRVEWLNDEETVKLFTGSPPARVYQRADAARWRQSLEADLAARVWAVQTKQGCHIGDIDLHEIGSDGRSAKLTVMLGDKRFWDRGYGSDAIQAILHYAFSELSLERVSLRVYDFNKRGIRCYEKCGFERNGPARTDSWKNSQPGEVHMVITRDRFLAGNSHVVAVRS